MLDPSANVVDMLPFSSAHAMPSLSRPTHKRMEYGDKLYAHVDILAADNFLAELRPIRQPMCRLRMRVGTHTYLRRVVTFSIVSSPNSIRRRDKEDYFRGVFAANTGIEFISSGTTQPKDHYTRTACRRCTCRHLCRHHQTPKVGRLGGHYGVSLTIEEHIEQALNTYSRPVLTALPS